MATPFTKGKKGTNRAGGHTSTGVHVPAGAKMGSTSKANNRVGGLKKRMTGASGTKGMPK